MKFLLALLWVSGALAQTAPAPSFSMNLAVPLPTIRATIPASTLKLPDGLTLTLPTVTSTSYARTFSVPLTLPLASLLPPGAVWTGLGTAVPAGCSTSTPALFIAIDNTARTFTLYFCSTGGSYVPLALGNPVPAANLVYSPAGTAMSSGAVFEKK